jgi:hypothetical protein
VDGDVAFLLFDTLRRLCGEARAGIALRSRMPEPCVVVFYASSWSELG